VYVHIGSDVVVRACDVVGVFDIESATHEASSRAFLAQAERDSRLTTLAHDLPRSFVVACESGVERIYLSTVSAATLTLRLNNRPPASGGNLK